MPIGHTSIECEDESDVLVERFPSHHRVLVTLNDEVMAAVEGWRSAHGFKDQGSAIGELVRIGLMSEIAKIYRLVSEGHPASDEGHSSTVRRRPKKKRPSGEGTRAEDRLGEDRDGSPFSG